MLMLIYTESTTATKIRTSFKKNLTEALKAGLVVGRALGKKVLKTLSKWHQDFTNTYIKGIWKIHEKWQTNNMINYKTSILSVLINHQRQKIGWIKILLTTVRNKTVHLTKVSRPQNKKIMNKKIVIKKNKNIL